MSDQTPNDELLIEGHDYDGIRELDNPLPQWWLWTFYLAIIFSALYMMHYHLTPTPSLKGEFDIAMEKVDAARQARGGGEAFLAGLAEKLKDPTAIQTGQGVYQSKCAVCHGPQGQGLIGPNLTDAFWLHGGSDKDVYKAIAKGVTVKGMPAWENQLKSEQLLGVAAYVVSLRGTNPPNAKAPQGSEYKE